MKFRYEDTTITVNMPDRETLLAEIRGRLRAGRGFALATINLDHLVKLRSDAAFRRAYAAHDLIVADGNPIVWLSRAAGHPVTLVPGSDLVLPMAALAADEGAPIALLGSTAEVLDAAAARLAVLHPGLQVVARIAPPMGFDPSGPQAAALLEELGATGARITFLALGAPKQEMLAARGRELLPAMGFLSVARASISSPGRRHGRRRWCGGWRWNGCGAPPRPRGGWGRAMRNARRSCRGNTWPHGASAARAERARRSFPRRSPRATHPRPARQNHSTSSATNAPADRNTASCSGSHTWWRRAIHTTAG